MTREAGQPFRMREPTAPVEEPEPDPVPMGDPQFPDDPGPAEDPEQQPVRD